MDPIFQYIILVVAGFGAGFINAVAGGGSTLTLPILIYMGLSPSVANGTNRIAILLQNVSANAGYHSKGVKLKPFHFYMALFATLGSVIGVTLAKDIDETLFKQILAAVMVLAVINIFRKKQTNPEIELPKTGFRFILSAVSFFFIGIYGGFIQVGTGIVVILAMHYVTKSSLLQANIVKVFVVLMYSIIALALFAYNGLVSWQHGLILAIGNSAGAYISSRIALKKGDGWIRILFAIAVIIMAVKLFLDI